MEKLKPCPFCGGQAELTDSNIYGAPAVFVRCTKCKARTTYMWIEHPSMKAAGLDEPTRYTKEQAEAESIEAWNRGAEDGDS